MNNLSILLTSQEYAPYTKYWTEKLSSYHEPFTLRSQKTVVKTGQQMDRLTFSLEPPQQKILTQLTQGRALETFIISLSGYYLLFAKYSGHCDIVIDSPLFNKGKLDNLLASKVSLLETLDFNNTLKELIIKVNQTVTQSYKYQNFPLTAVVQDESQVRTNVFISTAEIHHTTSTPLDDYDLIIEIKRSQFVLTYNTACFSEEFIQNMTSHYQNILGAYKNVNTCIKEVSLLSDLEKHQVLVAFNNTQTTYPREQSIVELFEAQVANTPEATAIVFQDHTLIYQDLNEKANQLAHYLREHYHIQPDDVVGLILERSEWMIIAIMGILKAGGAYLPIEPDNPVTRIQLMLDDSKASVVLIESRLIDDFPQALDIKQLVHMLSTRSKLNLKPINKPTHLAYVMYTSGSTGIPKGVLVEHRSIIRLVKNTNFIDFQASDHIAQLSSYAFDASTFEIWGALLNGASLYLPQKHETLAAAAMKSFMQQHQISITWLTASLFNHLLEADWEIFKGLHYLLTGGEKLSVQHVNKVKAHCPKLVVINGYGPTENTTFTCCHRIDQIYDKDIPIGRPIANTHVLILGVNDELMPIGIAGEICAGGDGLARGYLNDPELTAAKFIRHPFHTGERLYRTGDLGCWLPDGTVAYLGRKNEQIKIRGYRVEQGEIEKTLLKHPAISQACVTARQAKSGTQELVAYFVGEGLALTALRDYLAQLLPDYMIPAYFVPLDSLPLNANGKVDKKALPAPSTEVNLGTAYQKPRNDMEEQLVNVWQEILGRKPIGIHDNYFALGGDSIKAIQVATQLHQVNLTLDVRNIFLYPTIAELAETVVINEKSAVTQETVTGWVPLTAIQAWFVEQYRLEGHFNQAVMLYSKQVLQEEVLRTVFSKIQTHHDALRIYYRLEGSQVIQENGDLDYPLHFETMNWQETAEAERQLTSLVETMQASLDLENGPLMKVALCHLPDGDRLVIVIHHLVVDGISWRILMADIQSSYQQALNGETIELPAKTESFKHWAEQVKEYSNCTALLAEKPYWQTVESTEIKLLPSDYPTTDDENLERDTRTVDLSLSLADTNTLLTQIHEAYRTEINDILLTALALTMSRWHGEPNTLITLEGHGREAIIEGVNISRTVGWFTSMYPVILTLPIEKDLGYQIKYIKETLRNIPHKGIGYGVLKYLTSADNKQGLTLALQPQISFNYLGQFDEDMDSGLFTLAKESTGDEINPDAKRCHDLEIAGLVVQGQLQFSFAYSHKHYQVQTIERLAFDYQQALREIMEHCLNTESGDLTPSDIDYDGLDIDELDDLLAQITENS